MKNTVIILYFFALLSLTGCNTSRTYNDDIKFTDNWMKQYSNIKNPKEYQPQLEKLINYFSSPEYYKDNKIAMYQKATFLMMTYSKLFLLEQHKGNKYIAEIYFQKAKYWSILEWEYSPTDATPKEIGKGIDSFTKANVKKWFAKLDPKFMKAIWSQK